MQSESAENHGGCLEGIRPCVRAAGGYDRKKVFSERTYPVSRKSAFIGINKASVSVFSERRERKSRKFTWSKSI